MTRLFCSIYKSSQKDEMYLYVLKADALRRVPEPLLAMFGRPRHVTDLMLSPERKLGRVDINQVLDKLVEQGFFLQMPPQPEPWLLNSGLTPAWSRQSPVARDPVANDKESSS